MNDAIMAAMVLTMAMKNKKRRRITEPVSQATLLRRQAERERQDWNAAVEAKKAAKKGKT